MALNPRMVSAGDGGSLALNAVGPPSSFSAERGRPMECLSCLHCCCSWVAPTLIQLLCVFQATLLQSKLNQIFEITIR